MARRLAQLGGLLALGALCGCSGSSTGGTVRDSAQDPLVRERVLQRMDELYQPAKTEAEEVRKQMARKECAGVCDSSKRVCDAAQRICELAADYPADDEEVQEKCQWSSTDCDTARTGCAPCQAQEEPAE